MIQSQGMFCILLASRLLEHLGFKPVRGLIPLQGEDSHLGEDGVLPVEHTFNYQKPFFPRGSMYSYIIYFGFKVPSM